MAKKYIKGKDGKFKGSIGDPNAVPQAVSNTSLPAIPMETTSLVPGQNSDSIMRLYEKAQLLQSSQNSASNLPKPPTVKMTAKNIATGQAEEMEVIESRLTNESRSAESNRLVRLPRDEVRFMDRDKLTNALGYSIMGQGFSISKNLVLYERYAEDPEYIVYRVDVKE